MTGAFAPWMNGHWQVHDLHCVRDWALLACTRKPAWYRWICCKRAKYLMDSWKKKKKKLPKYVVRVSFLILCKIGRDASDYCFLKDDSERRPLFWTGQTAVSGNRGQPAQKAKLPDGIIWLSFLTVLVEFQTKSLKHRSLSIRMKAAKWSEVERQHGICMKIVKVFTDRVYLQIGKAIHSHALHRQSADGQQRVRHLTGNHGLVTAFSSRSRKGNRRQVS